MLLSVYVKTNKRKDLLLHSEFKVHSPVYTTTEVLAPPSPSVIRRYVLLFVQPGHWCVNGTGTV